MISALYAATATKTVQAATVKKSLQFRRRRRDFFALVWGLPLVAVYVSVRDKIRSEGFAVAANISRRSGGAFCAEWGWRCGVGRRYAKSFQKISNKSC